MNKKYVILTIIVALVVLGVAGLSTIKGEKKIVSEYTDFPTEYVEEVDLGIDEQNISFLEKRIAEYQLELDKEDLPKVERINYLVAQSFDYRSLGDYSSMDEAIEEAAVLAPDSQAILKTYSEMLFVQGRYQESLDVIDEAIAIDTESYLPWLWRAELEEQLLIDPVGAWVIFDQALKLTDYDVDIMIAYAEFLERQDKNKEALAVWKIATTRYPERGEAFQEKIDRLEE